jgi:hypothetical protein
MFEAALQAAIPTAEAMSAPEPLNTGQLDDERAA